MSQYLQLGHMIEIRENSKSWNIYPQFYLPHHSVIKETSTTTKLRVVFNASNKTSTGISLIDALMIGPVLQQDLFSILIRVRSWSIVITTDIVKMYRQILVNENQTSLQRIVWREHPSEDIKTYELVTLTYGTAPASYLATEVILELARLEGNKFPIGASIIRRDFYMDDLITEANTLAEAITIRNQVTELMKLGGFALHKWASNKSEILETTSHEANSTTLNLDKDGLSRTLGVKWNRLKDAFQYSIQLNSSSTLITKRSILSSIAQVFDPLDLLAPVLVKTKIMMQTLWKSGLDWDEVVPPSISSEWSRYSTQLKDLNDLNVNRKVFDCDTNTDIQLHGFADASERAYGACIYVRCNNARNEIEVHLLYAKSRVAPIKTVSIPRLELCGAQLLAQLMKRVKEALGIDVQRTFYWTDSSIVLHWLKSVKKLPVFVAHRIGEIQNLTSIEDWNHVDTKENPADLISRGCNPKELLESTLWWQGPLLLQQQSIVNSVQHLKSNISLDKEYDKQNTAVALIETRSFEDNWIVRFSTFKRLIRVTAMCIRFTRLCRRKSQLKVSQVLTLDELNYATKCLITMEQRSAFSKELTLQSSKNIANNSDLRNLNPFIDSDGLLRVGGRLKNANLQYSTKHPLILPHHSKLTELIIQHEHVRNFHAGADTTLAAVRQSYWPIRARGTVKKLLHKCIICFKAKPRSSEQIMGDLPVYRVKTSRPFSSTGVDFCGPIFIREGRCKGAKRIKAYVAVFVCMAVKAIHLEVVSDLTTDAFLNAFKRFISRRGKPTDVFSDNGTNFVGANRELSELKILFLKDQNSIIDRTASEGIRWHFIPARSPHFDGLWESNVKSFKRLFYKVTNEASLTFEEASTLVAQIESILNSRPLTAISEDPNDLDYLSPGHFLIGNSLTLYPEPDITQEKIGRLSKWQLVERIRQHFWKRWSAEYLLSLQQRNKWKASKGPQLKPGQLVICKDDGLPPLKWAIGRVQEVYPGTDGIIRTALVKTTSGEYKRPAITLYLTDGRLLKG